MRSSFVLKGPLFDWPHQTWSLEPRTPSLAPNGSHRGLLRALSNKLFLSHLAHRWGPKSALVEQHGYLNENECITRPQVAASCPAQSPSGAALCGCGAGDECVPVQKFMVCACSAAYPGVTGRALTDPRGPTALPLALLPPTCSRSAKRLPLLALPWSVLQETQTHVVTHSDDMWCNSGMS